MPAIMKITSRAQSIPGWDQVEELDQHQVGDQVLDQVHDQVEELDQLQVGDQVQDQVHDQVEEEDKDEDQFEDEVEPQEKENEDKEDNDVEDRGEARVRMNLRRGKRTTR